MGKNKTRWPPEIDGCKVKIERKKERTRKRMNE